MNIKEKTKLNNLDRLKKTRHDANYKGFVVPLAQAKEIIELWDSCSKEIIENLLKELR